LQANSQIAELRTKTGEEFFDEYCNLTEMAKDVPNCYLKGQFTALEKDIVAYQNGCKEITKEFLKEFIKNTRDQIKEFLNVSN